LTVVLLLAACGSVRALPDDAAMSDTGGPPDAWQPNCIVTAPLITTIESDNPVYSNKCLNGTWRIEVLNGASVPQAAEEPGHAAIVRPTGIALDFNTLDTQSTFAIHVSGSGQMNSGDTFTYAQLWAPLNNPGTGMVGTVDATAYTGVQFYAIINTAPTGARFRVANLYTDPAGGMCSLDSKDPSACYDHPGAQLAPSTVWTKYQVPFKSLTQVGFGHPSPVGDAFPRSAITVVRWDINIPPTGPTGAWELWVDDVTFY
jgi:hypothetical protein